MHDFNFLTPLVIIFGISVLVVFLLGKLKVPSIIGFLIAGVFLGPHGLQLVSDVELVELMAEIGVILLLFTIGLEFSLRHIYALRKSIFVGGFLQIFITLGAVVLISMLFGIKYNTAIVFAMLVSLSSTAIVLKILLERAEMESPHGRITVGVLIFQDLSAVLFILAIPLLSEAGSNRQLADVIFVLLKSFFIVGIVLVSAHWLIPKALDEIAKTRKRELFVISIMFLCLGAAFFTYKLGLSLALGAFLAGLIISESNYAYQATSDVLPFKESFNALFFVSIGMLLNVNFLFAHYINILLIVAAIIFIKVLACNLAIYILIRNLRIALHSSIILAQVGEFSFVLSISALKESILNNTYYQVFLASAIITMVLTPFLISMSSQISKWVTSKKSRQRLEQMRTHTKETKPKEEKKHETDKKDEGKKTDHVIIVGFGINGKNLASVLKELDIPYVILELNISTVNKMRDSGQPIYFGDGTSMEILHKVNIEKARVLVVTIPDPVGMRNIVQTAKAMNPHVYIVVRTRFMAEVEALHEMGADEVIPEEFETSIEIFSRVLKYFHMPPTLIKSYAERIRQDHYRIFTKKDTHARLIYGAVALMPGQESKMYLVEEGSFFDDNQFQEIKISYDLGYCIVAVKRQYKLIMNPDANFIFKKDDKLYAIGDTDSLNRLDELVKSP